MTKEKSALKARVLLVEDKANFRTIHMDTLERMAGKNSVHAMIDVTTAAAVWELHHGYEVVIVNGTIAGHSGLALVDGFTQYSGKPSVVYVISSNDQTIEQAKLQGYRAYHKIRMGAFHDDLKDYFGIAKNVRQFQA